MNMFQCELAIVLFINSYYSKRPGLRLCKPGLFACGQCIEMNIKACIGLQFISYSVSTHYDCEVVVVTVSRLLGVYTDSQFLPCILFLFYKCTFKLTKS